MGGPDELDGVGLTLNLPQPTKLSLGDYKVAVWTNDAVAPVSQEVQDRVSAVAKTHTSEHSSHPSRTHTLESLWSCTADGFTGAGLLTHAQRKRERDSFGILSCRFANSTCIQTSEEPLNINEEKKDANKVCVGALE